MAEAEELVGEAARHATVYARELWRRHRPAPPGPVRLALADLAPRLKLLLTAALGVNAPLRRAQPPPRATLLAIVFAHHRQPRLAQPVPATDGTSIWLPPELGLDDAELASLLYRAMALQQGWRARRGGCAFRPQLTPLQADVYLLLEACAADRDLVAALPGMAGAIDALKRHALSQRPALSAFPRARAPLERLLRELLALPCGQLPGDWPAGDTPEQLARHAQQVISARALVPAGLSESELGPCPLLKDWWTGDLRAPSAGAISVASAGQDQADDADGTTPRASRLARRPEQRQALPDEDEGEQQGAWMVQGDEPHQHAEDPMGLQRPVDRDDETGADHFGDLVSELPEARLVATPGRPKEVLLADDPPDFSSRLQLAAAPAGEGIRYPEWDYRSGRYSDAGAQVRLQPTAQGSQQWVDATLALHKGMLKLIRRRFELLRARPVWQRKQLDGDDIDLAALTDAYAELRAGHLMEQAFYQSRRAARRDLAITLLIDISGSTDGWINNQRRVIDVEREALLLVCVALEGLGEPYSILAFSGQGPEAVSVRVIKHFEERYSNAIALRISALEPEHYTRAGAALRHATAELMRQPAAHRLLLLLSDGKPNDQDHYEGRYGVEDMRQAVTEAKQQGVYPFCLTIDRQAASYLQRVFGAHQYALLPKPERLPLVLLDWMKRLAVN